MRAVAVFPKERAVRLIERDEPQLRAPSDVKLRMLEVGVCGTDRELCEFVYGTPPPGSDHFILGHESLAEVIETGSDAGGFRPGDLVVAGVRLPCPEEDCQACREGHQDFCSSGNHREHGIKNLDGFMAEFVVQGQQNLFAIPRELRRAGVLLEPLTIAEKALHQAERIETRLPWRRTQRRALVLGAGPVGLLGAMKLVQSGYDTWIYSRDREPNRSATIAAAIGAHYLSSETVPLDAMREEVGHIDLVYEALGAAQIAFDVLLRLAPNGIYVFTGIPRAEELHPFDTFRTLSNLVLCNQAIVGTVNAGRRDYLAGIEDLLAFELRWPNTLESLITCRYRIEDFQIPVELRDGIKSVIDVIS